jgi:hypothetical protein
MGRRRGAPPKIGNKDEATGLAPGVGDDEPLTAAPIEGAADDAAQRGADDGEKVKGDLPPEDTANFDARENIAKNRRSKRDEQIAEHLADPGTKQFADQYQTPDDGAGDDGQGDDTVTDDGADAGKKAADANDPIQTLTIDGKKVEMKLSEVIARAQISTAADERLRQLNAALDEVKKLKGGDQTTAAAGEDVQSGKPAPSAADQPDRKALAKQLVHDIQMGDADDALAERLANFIGDARSEGLTPAEVRAAARDELRVIEDEENAQHEFARVTQANEILAKNEYVQRDFFGSLVGQALDELRSIGMTEEAIGTILKGAPDATPNQLVRINHDHYRRLRNADGSPVYPKLSSPDKLMKGAASAAIKRWNEQTGSDVKFAVAGGKPTASGAAPAVDRSARKRGIETHRASSDVSNAAGVGRLRSTIERPVSREESKRAGFAQIKAARQNGAR